MLHRQLYVTISTRVAPESGMLITGRIEELYQDDLGGNHVYSIDQS